MSNLIIKRVLLNLYVNEGMTMRELADLYKCSQSHIHRQLKSIPGFKARGANIRPREQNPMNLQTIRGMLNHDVPRDRIAEMVEQPWGKIHQFVMKNATYEYGRYLHRERTKAAKAAKAA